MSVVLWVDPNDCDPPHGLNLTTAHDADKVAMLAEAFESTGYDKRQSALIGYPKDGRIQLLSGTHRHEAAKRTNTKVPVVLWLRSSIEEAWGELDDWMRVMKDVAVSELETWTREDVERNRRPVRNQ